MRRNLLILSLTTMLLATLAAGQLVPSDTAMPTEYVTDLANVVTVEDERTLNHILEELEQKAGVQYIILTVQSTNGVPIEDFSIQRAHTLWKLGQKGKDNGLLFTLALKDRDFRFEVGYGLEGFITDAYVGQVGRDVLVPYLKRGQYSQGITEANLRVVQRIAEHEGVKLTGMPVLAPQPRAGNRPVPGQRGGPTCFVYPCCGFLILLFLLMMLFGGRGGGRGGHGSLWWMFLLPFLFNQSRGPGRHRSYGPFGGGYGGFGGGMRGGFGGGGFGPFGGGGGGGFGGGGATGHW